MSCPAAPRRSASGRGSRSCCRGRRSRTRRWRRQERPALGAGHVPGSVAQARICSDRMPGPGPIALVGSGEFLPAMAEIDAALLAASGRAEPRVAILPTASWPDGEEVFRRWADMGAEHFTALGAEVEPVLVRDRFDADDDAPRPGDRRGRPRLPVGRQARPPDREPRSGRGRASDRRGPRARRGAGRLLGRGDDPRRPPLRLPGPAAALVPLRWRDGLGARAERRPSSRTTTPGRRRCPRPSSSSRRAAS